jgi:hypothetical protein
LARPPPFSRFCNFITMFSLIKSRIMCEASPFAFENVYLFLHLHTSKGTRHFSRCSDPLFCTNPFVKIVISEPSCILVNEFSGVYQKLPVLSTLRTGGKLGQKIATSGVDPEFGWDSNPCRASLGKSKAAWIA